jgi:hypothetical protein
MRIRWRLIWQWHSNRPRVAVNRLATGSISTAPAATTVNTAADWDLTVTLQAANSTNGDTITLDAMTVVLF